MDRSIPTWIVIGLIAGLLARLLTPGAGPRGCIVTVVVGIVGAVIGGFLMELIGGVGVTGVNLWSVFVATLGAIVFLIAYRAIAGGR